MRACSCQHWLRKVNQVLAYSLFKIQSILFLASSRKGWAKKTYFLFKTRAYHHQLQAEKPWSHKDSDLQDTKNQCMLFFSFKYQKLLRHWLTSCPKFRAWSGWHQIGESSQIVTYNLFTCNSWTLSTLSKVGQPDDYLHAIQDPEHALVSSEQEG